MKKLIPLFALTAAILTACPSPTVVPPPTPPVGTAIPTTGGTVPSGDSKASFVAPSAGAGTFVNVTTSSDAGSVATGQTFVSAYNFQVTAGSVASATVSIQFATAVAPPASGSSRKGNLAVNRLYKRDGAFWRYVTGQTSTSTSVSAVVSSYGVYGVLSGIATIKDVVITPSSVTIDLTGKTSAVQQQMTAVERDSNDQPIPSVDSSITWTLGSQFGSQLNPQVVVVAPVDNTIDNTTGLLYARVATAAGETIVATGNQNKFASVPLTVTGSLLAIKQ